ncbi:hypothetical protein IAI09_11365 [Lysinibacillus fusiformis]|nr:hypothetical protein [Lysinibacillus fusiformis]
MNRILLFLKKKKIFINIKQVFEDETVKTLIRIDY